MALGESTVAQQLRKLQKILVKITNTELNLKVMTREEVKIYPVSNQPITKRKKD